MKLACTQINLSRIRNVEEKGFHGGAMEPYLFVGHVTHKSPVT
jgi:hypothetical protein